MTTIGSVKSWRSSFCWSTILSSSIGIDPGRTLEREDHFLRPRAGLNLEHHSALAVGDVLDLVVDLRLQVVVGHQPLAQRIRAVVGPLLVEDAAMPLRADLVLDLLRRRRAHELQIDARSERHAQRQVGLVGLDAALEPDARLQVALLDERLLDALDTVANLEEVVVVSRLDAERLAHRGLVRPGWNDDREFGDLRRARAECGAARDARRSERRGGSRVDSCCLPGGRRASGTCA